MSNPSAPLPEPSAVPISPLPDPGPVRVPAPAPASEGNSGGRSGGGAGLARNSWAVYAVHICALLLIYALSLGPMAFFLGRLGLGFYGGRAIVVESGSGARIYGSRITILFYTPLTTAYMECPPVKGAMDAWLSLWGCKIIAIELDRPLSFPPYPSASDNPL